jgi:hypothetical protein
MNSRTPALPPAKAGEPQPDGPRPEPDRDLDRELDEELDATFPASDPLPWSHEVK